MGPMIDEQIILPCEVNLTQSTTYIKPSRDMLARQRSARVDPKMHEDMMNHISLGELFDRYKAAVVHVLTFMSACLGLFFTTLVKAKRARPDGCDGVSDVSNVSSGQQYYNIKKRAMRQDGPHQTAWNGTHRNTNWSSTPKLPSSSTNLQSDVVSYNAAIGACAASGDIERAKAWVNKLREKGFKPNVVTYGALISACAKAGEVDQAQSFLDRMIDDGVEANVICYNTAIDACAKAGDVNRAEAIMEKMCKNPGVEPDVLSYNSVINACSKCNDVSRGEKWLLRMAQAGVQPNAVTYTTLINACAKCRDVPRAERWLMAMESKNIEPNIISYNTVINACAKEGAVARAEYWLSKMKQVGISPDIIGWNAVLNSCAKAGDVTHAEELLKRMVAEGVEPNTVSFNTVIHCCGQAKRVARAEFWLNQMIEREGKPMMDGSPPVKVNSVTYNSVIDACIKCNEVSRALSWLHKMDEHNVIPDAISYHALVHALCKAGDAAPAEQLLQSMIDRLGERKAASSTTTFACVISVLSRTGSVEKAFDWYYKMRSFRATVSVEIYSALISCATRVGDPQKVDELFEEARRYRKTSVAMYTIACRPHVQIGNYAKVEEYFENMKRDKLHADTYCMDALLSAYANAMPKAWREAENAFVRMMKMYDIEINQVVYGSLRRAVGSERANSLLQEVLSPAKFSQVQQTFINVPVNGETQISWRGSGGACRHNLPDFDGPRHGSRRNSKEQSNSGPDSLNGSRRGSREK